MNYGETLTYWYLRLNGFFPITNFVLHRPYGDDETEGVEHRAEADLLALRLPYVYEQVGGQVHDWDTQFAGWEIDLMSQTVGLIVEVKTGDFSNEDVTRAFRRERLRYGVRRLGLFPKDEAADIADEMLGCPGKQRDGWAVAKLLVADKWPKDFDYPCLRADLCDIDQFVRERMRKYIDEKESSRLFFPDDLAQYIIWQEWRAGEEQRARRQQDAQRRMMAEKVGPGRDARNRHPGRGATPGRPVPKG